MRKIGSYNLDTQEAEDAREYFEQIESNIPVVHQPLLSKEELEDHLKYIAENEKDLPF